MMIFMSRRAIFILAPSALLDLSFGIIENIIEIIYYILKISIYFYLLIYVSQSKAEAE